MWACVRILHYEYETGGVLFSPLPDFGEASGHDVDLMEFGCEAGEIVCGREVQSGSYKLHPESSNSFNDVLPDGEYTCVQGVYPDLIVEWHWVLKDQCSSRTIASPDTEVVCENPLSRVVEDISNSIVY